MCNGAWTFRFHKDCWPREIWQFVPRPDQSQDESDNLHKMQGAIWVSDRKAWHQHERAFWTATELNASFALCEQSFHLPELQDWAMQIVPFRSLSSGKGLLWIASQRRGQGLQVLHWSGEGRKQRKDLGLQKCLPWFGMPREKKGMLPKNASLWTRVLWLQRWTQLPALLKWKMQRKQFSRAVRVKRRWFLQYLLCRRIKIGTMHSTKLRTHVPLRMCQKKNRYEMAQSENLVHFLLMSFVQSLDGIPNRLSIAQFDLS